MKPERWLQIEELCQAALDRPEEQRASLLDSRCAGDQALRREVESLLRYQEPANNFIEAPALEVAAKVAAADQARPLIRQQISHYRTLSLLGAGGMGTVYLAEDVNLNRRIALKLLPSEFTRNVGRVRRFRQEARALSALNHPNIVTIYEIGEVEETHYIATEFIDGQTLRQQLNNEMISLRDAIDVAAQVASALAVAHDSGVVHRDIKPENIMVRKDGLVKVLDFGLAKLAEAEADDIDTSALKNEAVSTETGALMGTVRYMSPEQALGLTLDARSDIFSLGVVLYEMLSGKSPFAGATTADVIAAILTKEPPPITQYRPEALDQLKRILTLSLQKERAERYQTAREMLADLKRVKQRLEIGVELLKQRLEIGVELNRNSATIGGLDHVTTTEENAVEAAAPPTISAENLRPVEPYDKTGSEGLAPPHKTTAVIWKLTAVVATLVLVFITTSMFLRNRPGDRFPSRFRGVAILADPLAGWRLPTASQQHPESAAVSVLKVRNISPSLVNVLSRATATISGKISFEGVPPPNSPVEMSTDPYCQLHSANYPTLETVKVSDGGLENVIIYVSSGLLPGVTYTAPTAPIELDQLNCHYIPHVLTMMTQQRLTIRNSDMTLNNVHAWSEKNPQFNVGQPLKDMVYVTTFPYPEMPLVIQDDIHRWKSAFVGVFDHPFHTVSKSGGLFELKLPPGYYEITAWHEKYGQKTTMVGVVDNERRLINITFAPNDN